MISSIKSSIICGPFSSIFPFSTNVVRGYRKGNSIRNNIGIKKRLTIFSEENPDLDKLQLDEQALDEIESELTSHREIEDFHRRSVEKLRKKTELSIVQRKYFGKVKLPNFLTWAEKEQIKELHRSEPKVWTYNKLSQSFPATPDIIKKVIGSNWKVESKERILKHDRQVSKNWQLLRKGELQLDLVLKNHLASFSSREPLNHTNSYDFVSEKVPSLATGQEFSKIITDYMENEKPRLEGKFKSDDKPVREIMGFHTSETPSEKSLCTPANESTPNVDFQQYTSETPSEISLITSNESANANFRRNGKQMTLEELRSRIKQRKAHDSISEFDEAILKGANRGETNTLSEVDNYETMPVKSLYKKASYLVAVEESIPEENVMPQENILMKIKIPPNTPKGSVYRVEDVYYDTDGQFLYRVPGMKQ